VASDWESCAPNVLANILCEHRPANTHYPFAMTIGMGAIVLKQTHDPEQIARALIRVGTILDSAAEGKPIEAHPALYPAKEWCPTATDWMVVALLIAARCEIDSMTLIAMAASVFKGEQDALFD